MANGNNIKFPIAGFEENEALCRIFLRHRFGIDDKATQKGKLHKNEELHYHLVLEELKKALMNFLAHQENIDKLVHHIKKVTSQPESIISDRDIKVQYHINIKQLIQAVLEEVMGLGSQEYIQRIPRRVKNKGLICIGVKIREEGQTMDDVECHIKGIVFFDEKIIKLNRFDVHKDPSLIIYKIQSFDQDKLETIINDLLKSFDHPLDQQQWDRALNEALHLEKINKISKREHAIGNCGWITAKMMVYSIVYAIIFQSLKELGSKDIVGNKIAIAIAEYWYRLLTIDDRNRSLHAYLVRHGYKSTTEPTSMVNRVKMLKEFLLNSPPDGYDKELLTIIYVKSLNWLLDEHLKVGDIGSAQQLLMEERENTLFNPLFFAARNGKISIADLLGTRSRYVDARDESGNTPLMIAAMRGNVDIMKILFKNRARNELDLMAVNQQGENALHLAVANKRREGVEYLLLIAPALKEVRDKTGNTPLEIAKLKEFEEIERILSRPNNVLKGYQKL